LDSLALETFPASSFQEGDSRSGFVLVGAEWRFRSAAIACPALPVISPTPLAMVLLRMLLGEDPGENLPDPYSSPLIFSAYFGAAVLLGSFAGICSGLTLGLLSMSRVDLEVMRRTGTEHERKCAERIAPVVANQHLLLVTLLLCNAFAAEALPLVIDRMANPVVAIILSMTVLLIMGEIVPQAICKSHALEIGAACTPLVRVLIFVCCPISWPIAKLLDYLLGEGHAAMFRRRQLEEFVDIHGEDEGLGGELTLAEINIIKGALKFSEKVAKEAMTPINKVFMLSSDAVLSQSTFNKILATGHSRIPIYRGEDKKDIMGVILVKELIGINPAARIPITHVPLRSLPVVSEDTAMYDMLELFETGRSHMALLMSHLPTTSSGLVVGASSANLLVTVKSTAKLTQVNSTVLPAQRAKRGKKKDSDEPDLDEATTKANPKESVWAIVEEPEAERPVEGIEAQLPIATGVITIEDCIEELIQDEIIDETDRYVDNIQSERVTAARLVSKLPVRLRSDFLKHFVPRSTMSTVADHFPQTRSEVGTGGPSAAVSALFSNLSGYSSQEVPVDAVTSDSTARQPLLSGRSEQ